MKQAWHTEGYDKLASACMYLTLSEKAGNISVKDAYRAIQVLVTAGKAIRKQVQRNANRRAKHAALTSLGLKRVKGALGGTYYE